MRSEQSLYQQPIERLVIVSNRLPIVVTKGKDGEWHIEHGSGGLVTALAPVLRDRGGIWIGWPGTSEDVELGRLLTAGGTTVGYKLEPVTLSEEEMDSYYHGFANEIVWPLFHDVQTRCNFDPAYWNAYQDVNRKFAQVVVANLAAGDYIWIHDYHLMLVAKYLREMGVEHKLGFFLHTPFPPLDIFIKLPWRQQIMEGLMAYDLLGFQTVPDRNNFLGCTDSLLKIPRSDTRRRVAAIVIKGREIRAGSFGISIDFDEFDRLARTPAVVERARELRQGIPDGKVILGIDRLDYSKGIPERLKAFQRTLERFEELHSKVRLIQVAVPSRVGIPEYQHLRSEIEGLVSRINGRFTQPGWVPIHYIFRSLDRSELVALYRASDIALITPLKDGMNLIAKEYCAANIDNNGVLILSEFAGAARRLGRNALLVNPYDIVGVADAIRYAFNMSRTERQTRMRRLRRSIRTRNIFWWLEMFLNASIIKDLDAIPNLSGVNPLDVERDAFRR
jgi:trehalose 6-phosphate synthase/phosphatase